MSLNIYGAIKLARTLAQKSGLTIQFEHEAMPRTDGRTLYLQRPRDGWGKAEWTEWWGLFYHETGHNDPDMRDAFTLIEEKKVDMDSFLGAGLNLIDDHRQEHHRIDEYYGRKVALSEAHNQILGRLIDGGNIGKDDKSKERQAMEAMMAFDTHCREPWMPHVSGKAEAISRELTPQSLQWYQELKDRSGEFDLKNVTTAEEEYELWKRIIDEVFKLDSQEQERKSQEAYEQKQGEGDGEKAQGSASEKESDGSGEGEAKGRRDAEATVRYDDLLKHKHGDEQEGAVYTPLHIEYGQPTYDREWEILKPHVVDYATEPCEGGCRYRRDIEAMGSTGKGLATTVRRLLQIRSKAKRVYGKKQGKLNGRSLHRLAVKDAKDYSERVFTQKYENNILDISVTVLGDASGSMGGDKYTHMAQSAILLNDALSVLKVPLEILTFSDRSREQWIGLIKGFQAKVTREKLVDRFVDFSRYMSGNADGEAILYAYSRLVTQRTKRKVLIVLSDGSPASDRGDADSHTCRVVKEIEKSGGVEIYGIGIQDDNVKRIYKDSEVIYTPEELERALITVIKTKILN